MFGHVLMNWQDRFNQSLFAEKSSKKITPSVSTAGFQTHLDMSGKSKNQPNKNLFGGNNEEASQDNLSFKK